MEAEMQGVELQDYARQLYEARGNKAVADAAQKARALEEEGNKQEAETWRRIEAILKEMLGPHAS
jgi:ribosomal protein S19